MHEGTKNKQKKLEELSTKETIKDIKRAEKENKQIKDGIPEGLPKIKEICTNVEKDEKIKSEKERKERLHEEYQKEKEKDKS